MLQCLREKLSKLSVRSRSRSGKRDKDADDDEHDALETPKQTLNPSPRPATLTSPSSPSIPPPSPSSSPDARGRVKATPPSSSPSTREYPWREQRLSARAVLASVVHAYKPKPRNQTNYKLTSLPPALLLAIFAYLQGDATRQANVDYRGASAEPDRWYSHDWSIMQVARTCRSLRALASPMLYSRAALIDKEDFLEIVRLPEHMRARIRHLTVSIAALEQLYVDLSAFATSSFPAFPHIRLSSPPSSPFLATQTKKPCLHGTPFAPCFVRTQLISLTLFRPDGVSARSGDAVLPGFAEFFVNDVMGYWRALESLHVRDARGVWPGAADVDLDMASMRTLVWDTALPPPRLEPGLRALTLGEQHVPEALPAGLRTLKTRAAIGTSAQLPDSLETLHILPPDGVAPPALRNLALPRLAALRDLRLSLASLAALEALVFPAGLHILQLHLPTLPSSPSLTRILEPLTHIRILSLVLPPTVARSPSPTRTICETDSAHAAHLPLALTLLQTTHTLREVHIGARDAEACVWGRPSWVTGREAGEVDVVWLGAGERMMLD